MTTVVLDYYAKHNRITDPGEHAAALDALPRDLAELHAAVDGFLVHIGTVCHES